jgi:hypothetical protein
LSKIDRAFARMGWCDMYPNHALPTYASDHAPLLLPTDLAAPGKQRFRFESIWPRLPGYLEAVVDGWRGAPAHADALDIKMRNTAKALKQWSQKFVGSVRFQLAVTKEAIFKLEQAQDTHPLSVEEVELRTELKFKCLGLASLAHTIARQCSRILHLKEGDANTCYFQLQACHRSKKSFIDKLTHQGCTLVDVLQQHFLVPMCQGHTSSTSTCCSCLSQKLIVTSPKTKCDRPFALCLLIRCPARMVLHAC